VSDSTAPLSFGQLAACRVQQAIPAESWQEYNQITTWPLPPGSSVDTLTRALTALAVRHESLRTHFDLSGSPRQIVREPATVDLRVRAGTTDRDAYEMEARAVATELAGAPYRLDTEAGWRAAALTDPAGAPAYFALSWHHIVADGWAIGRFRSELQAVLAAGGAPPPSGGPVPQPRELAREQHSDAWRPIRQSTRRYWTRLFDEIPPAVRADPPDDAGRIESCLYSADARLALAAAARQTRLAPATIMLALSAIAVHVVRSTEDRTLTLVSNNRFVARWQPLISSMSQNLPFPCRVDCLDEDLAAYGRRLYAAAVQGYRHTCYDVDEFAEYSTRRLGGRLVHDNYVNYSADVTADGPPARRDPLVENVRARRTTGPRVYVKVFSERDELVVDIRVDPRLVDEARLHRILWWYHDELRRLAGGEVSRLGPMIERCR
jgi:hypothetical protein